MVETVGAVQAQDFSGAIWGVGLRVKKSTYESIVSDFNTGKILRTHVMRPTWHFVSPQDIRWMLVLTRERVSKRIHAYNAPLGLNETIFSRANKQIEKELQKNDNLTRQELKHSLHRVGISTTVQKLAHLVMRAELDGLITSGPLRGKQFTYALMDNRAPASTLLPREKMLGMLAERYFSAHGPATLHDFSWWSGLTLAETREGVTHSRGLEKIDYSNQTYWFSKKQKTFSKEDEKIYLLPNYDEYTIGYWSKHALYLPVDTHIFSGNGFYHTIVCRGKVVGTWKRILQKNSFIIQTKFISPLNKDEKEQLQEAVHAYGEFFGMKGRLSD